MNKKVVINTCFGGFELSKEAYDFLGLKWDNYGFEFIDYEKREDKRLVECVEKLGLKASAKCSKLVVIEIPDDVEYEIHEYDGNECIREKHRMWN